MGGITQWLNPEVNQTAFIVYQIDCEGRDFLYKTQSLSVQYEGNTGPGIVMRGIWKNDIDYIGSDISGNRRDAVIHPDPATNGNVTQYYGAIQESGPGTAAGIQAPTGTTSDNAYWQYLGNEEFFVAAQIAIFQESYVKNTINVGTKDGSGAFANIVIAGGRPDPYIAIGQTGTQGTAGTSGTSLATPGIIGYNRPGVFLGLYEDGANGTTGRFSIKTTGTSGKGMFWDGDQLTIVGSIRQRQPGIPEGSFRGAWQTATTYYEDDTVTYGGASYICGVSHTSTNDTNINTGYPPNATNSWSVYAAAGTSGVSGTSGLSGTNGANGAGVVYRGLFSTSAEYFHTTERRDIVKQGSTYYLVNNTSKNGQSGTSWGSPPNANWTTFGAQFTSVATDVLFAVEQYVDKSINIGARGANALIVLNANESGSNANPYISIGQISSSIGPGSWVTESQVQGFNNSGIFLGFDGGQPKLSLKANSGSLVWDRDGLEIVGSITSNDGVIGGWTIGEGSIISKNQNIQLYSEPSESIAVFDNSGSLRFFANTQLTLPSPSGVTYSSATISAVSTSSFQQNAFPNDGAYTPGEYGIIGYDSYIIPASNGSFTALTSGQHIITLNIPANASSWARAMGDAGSTLNLLLLLTKTGHAPQFYTEYVGQSNYATAWANGSIAQYQIWNGFGWEYYYYPTPGSMDLPATKLSLIADLQQGVTYYLTLKVYSQLQSRDTGLPLYPPFGIDSQAETSFNLPSTANIIIKTISAGTVVNGGGFQAVLADDKFLRVKDGIDGGQFSTLPYSVQISGSLMVDQAISKSTKFKVPGHPAAIKAFGRVVYNSGAKNLAGSYSILYSHGVDPNSLAINTTYKSYQINFSEDVGTTEYEMLVTPVNTTYTTNNWMGKAYPVLKATTHFIFRQVDGNFNVAYLSSDTTGTGVGDTFDFIIFGK
jgi:hypothetical protein